MQLMMTSHRQEKLRMANMRQVGRPLFRADHVGSLLRPTAVRAGFRQLNEGQITAADYRQIQDEAIRHVVKLQEDAGLQAITDGEFRRASYWSHFVEVVEGLAVKPAVYVFRDEHEHEQAFLAPHVNGRLQRTHPISGHEYDFQQATTTQTAKLTLPTPPTKHFWRGRQAIEPGINESRAAYFADLAREYQSEIADLAARGATYLQIDEVPLAMLCDPHVRQTVQAAGDDPAQLMDEYVALLNKAVKERPSHMTIAMHLCRGNYKAHWLAEGGYDFIAERLFNEINVDVYFLEYDTPRAGDFTPLQHVPAHKAVVLGLVSSKAAALETADSLRRRLDEAGQYINLNQLGISPQCGFASTVAGNPLTEDDERRKLELLVTVANAVWGD
jgi:5-methyltetrahydropteroyltriglutamate--homocysteine methyltransferase